MSVQCPRCGSTVVERSHLARGLRCRQERKRLGWTQQRVAHESMTSQAWLSRFERGVEGPVGRVRFNSYMALRVERALGLAPLAGR